MSNTISKNLYKKNMKDKESLNIKMDIFDIIQNNKTNNSETKKNDENNYENNDQNNDEINDEINDLIQEYINSLNEQELIVLEIAKKHLESSFDISKSIGYLKWLNQNNLE